MNFDNIPAELRSLKQWCCFDVEEGGKKIPYIAGNCAKASSNNPETWRTFEEATVDIVEGKRQHLGLAITHPYVFIDLDEPQPHIFDSIDSYSQRSQSGKGTHIICRSHFEGEGIHPKSPAVGMFKESRFCLFTADVVEGRNEIKDFDPETLQQIYDWLSNKKQSHTTTNLVEIPITLEDEEVLERCRKRFDTFDSLWNGNAGEDHSASDHALISALADECESNEQVTRLWFSSPLCRPHRRNQKYVDMTLKKIRGKQEFFKLHEFQMEDDEPEPSNDNYPCGDHSLIDSMPDGTLKQIAQWHYSRCRYPLQECSVVTALSSAATVSGRNYQIQGGGLNPWIILVGPTGCGKSNYQNGMSKLFYSIANSNSFGTQHFTKMLVGKMASGEGLEDILSKRKRINSYFPEFHETWQGLVQEGRARHLSTLKQALLDLHGQATKGAFMKQRVKAFGKDDEEKEPVEAPCLTVSGETTPEEFYGSMSARDISNGWLQRFMIVNIETKSISLKKNLKRPEMSEALSEKVLDIFSYCDQLEINEDFIDVGFEKEAAALIDDFEEQDRIKNYTGDNIEQASNRGAMRALQIMGLFAIWDNHRKPVVTLEQAKWALAFVLDCDQKIRARFSSGEVGIGQTKQESEIRELLKMIVKSGKAKRLQMGINGKLAGVKDAVPYLWLKRKVIASNSFASDRNGASDAFEKALRHMETGGEIIRIRAEEAETKYGVGCGAVIGVK